MLTTSSLHDKIKEYLNENHYDEIYALGPKSTFTLQLTDPVIQELFLQHPEDFKEAVKSSVVDLKIEQVGRKYQDEFQEIKIKLVESKLITLKEMYKSADYINSPVFFEAVVLTLDTIESYISKYYYQCPKCGESDTTEIEVKEKQCVSCSTTSKDMQKMNYISQMNKFNYYQDILIQEPQEVIIESASYTPQIVKARLRDELVNTCEIGKRYRILGMLKPVLGKDDKAKLVIEIISHESLEDTKEAELTDDELKKFTELSKNEDEFVNSVILPSVAPHVEGNEIPKLFGLFSIVGGEEMGKYKPEINLFLVGDPGVAKSEILKFIAFKLIQRGAYVDGPNATTAGLLYGLDEYDNRKILRAGAMVINNGGTVIIDEFDKMQKQHRMSLNTALGSGYAVFDKNGHNKRTPIRTTVIVGCNPNNESWRESLSIMENLEPIEEPIINKFPVIIRLKDQPNRERDKRLIRHIIQNFQGDIEGPIPPTQLKAYLNYCKKLKPRLSKEAEDYIEKYYVDFRQIEQDDKADLPIKPRQAIGVMQLCIAYAKLTLQKSVTVEIVQKTIEYYKKTLETLNIRTDNGIHQVNLRGENVNKDVHFKELTKKVSDENGTWNDEGILNAMIEEGKTHWPSEAHAHVYWNRIKEAKPSLVFEPKPGRYTWV